MNITLPEVAQAGEQYIAYKYVELFSVIGLLAFLIGAGVLTAYIVGKVFIKIVKEGGL